MSALVVVSDIRQQRDVMGMVRAAWPASTGVTIVGAGLMSSDALVEIMMTAAR